MRKNSRKSIPKSNAKGRRGNRKMEINRRRVMWSRRNTGRREVTKSSGGQAIRRGQRTSNYRRGKNTMSYERTRRQRRGMRR